MSDDDAIRGTNDDASGCKRSAVHAGYWKDPYIQYFIRAGERKAPEIHRGYFARVQGVQLLLKQFLELTKCNCQVVNLGAGYDTTYWNLKDEGLSPKNFIEVDFEAVTTKKGYYIHHRKPLLEKLNAEDAKVEFIKTDLHSSQYHIVSADMRRIGEVEDKLKDCKIDTSLPTAFMAECVLVYMPAQNSTDLLQWISKTFSTAFFVNYEQVNMGDRFGEVMMQNLKARGCSLAGVQHCMTLETQRQRFLTTGWDGVDALDMTQVYKSLPQDQVQRFKVPGLPQLAELQDELFSHYCVTWAYRKPDASTHGLETISLPAPIPAPSHAPGSSPDLSLVSPSNSNNEVQSSNSNDEVESPQQALL